MTGNRAQRLLDAQVAWLIDRITGPDLPALIERDVDDLLGLGARVRLDELIRPDDVKRIARQLAADVPPSTAASTLVEKAADVAYDGPAESFTLAELVDREHVERLVNEVLGSTDLIERALDGIADSPLAAGLGARFVGRIVNDVLQANRAVAEKIPGVGSLVSFGASAAGKVMGAADKQFEQFLGDTAGKGAAFAMRRLNRIVIETLKDPATRRAVLQVFDMYADEPVPRLAEIAERRDARRIAALLQDMVITGADAEPVLALIDALIDGFFEVYGEHPPATLLEELGITRDDLVEHATTIVPGVLAAARESGELDRIIRERLAPFYESPEVLAILEE